MDVNEEIFADYFRSRCEAAQAVTVGQRLEVLRVLREEARQGRVPVERGRVARLDPNDPPVAAILRGEKVVLAADEGGNASAASVGPRGKLSGRGRLLLLAGVFLIPVLLALLFVLWTSKPPSVSAASTTEILVVDWMPTATLAAEATFSPTPTPTSTPTPTPAPLLAPAGEGGVRLVDGGGAPADSLSGPASLEINGQIFVVREGELAEDGTWTPQGVEWLPGTFVRRVIAIPDVELRAISVHIGDRIYVRLRNGYVVAYVVVQVGEVTAGQIELLTSTKPSVLVFGWLEGMGTPYRYVVIGEMYVPGLPSPLPEYP